MLEEALGLEEFWCITIAFCNHFSLPLSGNPARLYWKIACTIPELNKVMTSMVDAIISSYMQALHCGTFLTISINFTPPYQMLIFLLIKVCFSLPLHIFHISLTNLLKLAK